MSFLAGPAVVIFVTSEDLSGLILMFTINFALEILGKCIQNTFEKNFIKNHICAATPDEI